MPEAKPAAAVPDIPSDQSETHPPGERHMPRGKAKTNGAATETNGVGNNKMEAVRRALDALGRNAKPMALRGHILNEYQLDIQPNQISSYKSMILKANGAPKKRGRKPNTATTPATAGVSIKDLKTVKELTTRLGVSRVRELLDLLA